MGKELAATPELKCLATKKTINENHKLAQKASAEAVERGVLAGTLLLEWKSNLPHGAFEAFVERHFNGSLRTARAYMQVAKHFNALPKSAAAAVLKQEMSIRGLLATTKPERPEAEEIEDDDAEPVAEVDSPLTETTEELDMIPCIARPDDTPEDQYGDDSAEAIEEPVTPPPSPVDFGKCPNCAGTKWDAADPFDVRCKKCGHLHGEPTGGADETRIADRRAVLVKTLEAAMRAFDDLNHLVPHAAEHKAAIAMLAKLWTEAKNWK